MIISNLTGGLGNQMFQYALARHLAIKNKTELKLHFTNALFCTQRSFALDCFNIQAEMATDEDLKKFGAVKNRIINRMLYLIDERLGIKFNNNVITQRFPYKFDPSVLSSKDNTYIQGYWQDERYFKDITDVIRKDFTLKKGLSEALPELTLGVSTQLGPRSAKPCTVPINRDWYTGKKNQDIAFLIKKTNSVSIHVRRGDFVKYNSSQILDISYYNNAVSLIKKKLRDPVFFVFSDDIEWCKNNLKIRDEVFYVKGRLPCDDMILMSLCKHNIIANSSFSLWGAWLNTNLDKIVIAPKK